MGGDCDAADQDVLDPVRARLARRARAWGASQTIEAAVGSWEEAFAQAIERTRSGSE